VASQDGWQVELITDGVAGLDRIEDEWSQLCVRSEDDLLFSRPAWVRAYATHQIDPGDLRIVTARRDGSLEAVLPVAARRVRLSGLPARRLRGATSVNTWSFDLVRAAGDTGDAAVAAMARHLFRLRGWDFLELPDIPEGGSAEGLAARAAESGHRVGSVEVMRSPCLQLTGWDGEPEWFLKGVSRNFRSVMRRALKRSHGKVGVERHEQADEAALARFIALEAAGWKGREGSAIGSEENATAYFRTLVAAAEQWGAFALHFLEHEGKTIAAQCGVIHRGRYFLMKIAHDEESRQLAPGHLITHAVLEDCAARGLESYHFTANPDEWKRKWTPDSVVHRSHYIFRRGLYGRALHFAKFGAAPRLRKLLKRAPAAVPSE